jgi:hypothetical protein
VAGVVHRGRGVGVERRQSRGMSDVWPPGLPPIFTREQARALGLSDRQLDRRLASGALVATRRGVFRRPEQPTSTASPKLTKIFTGPPTAAQPLPVDVRAALLATPGRQLVISHTTAARFWGLPQPLGGWGQPQFIATAGSNRRRSGLQIRVAPLDHDDVVSTAGVEVTSVARTVADCLRSLPERDGLAVVDAALRRRLIVASAVLEVLGRQPGWPGVGVARQVLSLADPRRESPLESWSAWAFALAGVPAPQWQVSIRGPDRRFLGRPDCWWAMAALAGEADGRAKYALAAAERTGDAQAVLDALQAERRREQRLRAVGAEVIRWSAADVLTEPAAHQLSHRILAAIAVGQADNHFTGITH